MTATRSFRAARVLAPLALLLPLVALATAADTITWTVAEQPTAGGAIRYTVSSPAKSGVITGRDALKIERGAFLDLWFDAEPGYQLLSVTKNGEEFTFFLDGDDHFRFGPVENVHNIVATYAPVLPSGTFDFNVPRDVPQIVDLTGTYTGITPTRHARDYALDVAMDETGKLTGMGTIAGIEPDGGGPLQGSLGKVSTVGDEPVIEAKGKFSGTRDGVPASGTGAFEGPALLGGPEQNVAEGSISYNAKAGGVPVQDKNVPVQMTVDETTASNVQRDWSLRLFVVEHGPGKSKKPYLTASALLTLPNGDVISFPEKKAKWSAKRGLTLKLKKGTNTTAVPNALDKKTAVTLTRLTLEEGQSGWHPSGGTIRYQFLGQKGQGDVLQFVE